MIKQSGDIIYPFSCESPTKPQTKGQVGELLISPESYKIKRRQGEGFIYAITIKTPEKTNPNPKKRTISELSRPLFQNINSMNDLKKVIQQKDTKLPDEVKRGYIGLTKPSPRKRLRTHGRNAKKGSHLKVHRKMRQGARKGKVVRATVIATAPLEKLGAVEEAYRQCISDNKENLCLNMRKGGAGGGGNRL